MNINISLFSYIIFTMAFLANFNAFSYAQKVYTGNSQNRLETMKFETVESTFLLRFLYKNTLGRVIRNGLTKKWFSSLAGHYCDRQISKVHIKPFIEEHTIDISEAQKSVDEFSTFNDFFIRTLKPHARPIDNDPLNIVAPADGQLIIFENIAQTMLFPIKQTNFNLEQFLGDKSLAEELNGGTIMIFRLAPWDYHRYHFPISCTPSTAKTINGRYESVNPLVYYMGIQPLTENERHVSILKTTQCNDVVMISVGALCVGKIIETYQPHQHHQKGAEAGYFCFGGSTLVLIFKEGTVEIDKNILANSQNGKETPIKMGMKIATIKAQA